MKIQHALTALAVAAPVTGPVTAGTALAAPGAALAAPASACRPLTSPTEPPGQTRTAGVVSGPASGYLLDDGSILSIPQQHHRGADKELVDTIGVAPDHNVPTNAADLSAGSDPALAKARRLLSNA